MRVTGKTVMEVTHNKTLTSMPPNTAKCVGIYLRTQTTRSLKNNYLQMVKQSVTTRGAYSFKCEYFSSVDGCAHYIFWYM